MANIWTVLRKGKQLANAETWKNSQLAASILVAVFGVLLTLSKLFGANFEISSEDINSLATGISLVVGSLLNAYTTAATTKKVGLPAESEDSADPPDTGGDRVETEFEPG